MGMVLRRGERGQRSEELQREEKSERARESRLHTHASGVFSTRLAVGYSREQAETAEERQREGMDEWVHKANGFRTDGRGETVRAT